MRVLQHEPEQSAQLREVPVAHVDAVDQNPAAVDVVEPQQQVEERRLARPGRADDADALPGSTTNDTSRSDELLAVVREPHVIELDPPARRRAWRRTGDAGVTTAGVVSSTVKMRSEAAIAACMMLNFSDRSEIGWKNRREYCRNATSTPSETTPSSAHPPPTTDDQRP